MLVWIVGSRGLLGGELCSRLECRRIPYVGTDRDDADITSWESLKETAEELRPTHIVNCAAYTKVDGAEKERESAYQINATGPLLLSRIAHEVGARLVHISTDYVFDGKGARPLVETDACGPINVYGMSKWEGEKNVLKSAPHACIIRTSWLFGRRGKNFLSQLIHWLKTEEQVCLVSDQINRPTYAEDLAEGIIDLLDAEGIYHFANGHPLSRVEIARSIQAFEKTRCHTIIPVLSTAFPAAAKRPLYTALDTTKVAAVLGREPRSWEEILTDYLKREIYAC